MSLAFGATLGKEPSRLHFACSKLRPAEDLLVQLLVFDLTDCSRLSLVAVFGLAANIIYISPVGRNDRILFIVNSRRRRWLQAWYL